VVATALGFPEGPIIALDCHLSIRRRAPEVGRGGFLIASWAPAPAPPVPVPIRVGSTYHPWPCDAERYARLCDGLNLARSRLASLMVEVIRMSHLGVRSESIVPLARFMDVLAAHPACHEAFGHSAARWLFVMEPGSNLSSTYPRVVITPTSLVGGYITVYAEMFEDLYDAVDAFKAVGVEFDERNMVFKTIVEPAHDCIFTVEMKAEFLKVVSSKTALGAPRKTLFGAD
jgi:hypothetical protein